MKSLNLSHDSFPDILEFLGDDPQMIVVIMDWTVPQLLYHAVFTGSYNTMAQVKLLLRWETFK